MNYLAKRAIYYTVIVAELLCIPYEDVIEKITGIFQQDNNAMLVGILTDKTFEQLKSSTAVEMRINYIKSFCSNPHEFGREMDEMVALEVKHDALCLIEELSKNIAQADPINALFRIQKEKLCFAPISTLLLYIQGRYDNRSAALLGRALKDGSLDAGIVLLSLSQKEQRATICNEMAKSQEFFLYQEIVEMLKNQYGFDSTMLVGNLLCNKKTTGDNV